MKKGVICTHPWTTLRLQPMGRHAPCCVASFAEPQKFPAGKKDIMELFNSKSMMNLRRMLLDGRVLETPCAHCVGNQNFGRYDFSPYRNDSLYVKQAISSYNNGEIALNYSPLVISASLSSKCNLKCIMCTQSRNSKEQMENTNRDYPVEGLIDFFEEVSFEGIEMFAISGGECFMTNDGIRIIEYVLSKKPKNTEFKVTTNGVLIGKYIDRLAELPHFGLEISVEGYKETYEHIRRGAKWDSVIKNIIEFDKKRNKENSFVHLVSVLMRSSICDLDRLVEELITYVDAISTIHVEGKFLFENIFSYPSLLEGLRWENVLENTIAYLNERGKSNFSNRLRNTLNKMRTNFYQPDQKIIKEEIERLHKLVAMTGDPWMYIGKGGNKFVDPKSRRDALVSTLQWFKRVGVALPRQASRQIGVLVDHLDSDRAKPTRFYGDFSKAVCSLSGKSILIWGSGGKYTAEVKPFLGELETQNRVIGFVDGDPGKVGSVVDGKRVYSKEEATGLDVDAVIIASFAYSDIMNVLPLLCRESCDVALPNGAVVESHRFLAGFKENLEQIEVRER